MADTLIQNENVIESAARGSIFNCVIDPSGTPLERSIAHEDVEVASWAMKNFSTPPTGPATHSYSAGVPVKLTMFDTAVSTDDMTVTVGGSPADSKITIVKTGWYMFSSTVAYDINHATTECECYRDWNGNVIYTARQSFHTAIPKMSLSIAPFIFEVTSASKDFELYFEVDGAGTADFWDGQATVKRIQ